MDTQEYVWIMLCIVVVDIFLTGCAVSPIEQLML